MVGPRAGEVPVVLPKDPLEAAIAIFRPLLTRFLVRNPTGKQGLTPAKVASFAARLDHLSTLILDMNPPHLAIHSFLTSYAGLEDRPKQFPTDLRPHLLEIASTLTAPIGLKWRARSMPQREARPSTDLDLWVDCTDKGVAVVLGDTFWLWPWAPDGPAPNADATLRELVAISLAIHVAERRKLLDDNDDAGDGDDRRTRAWPDLNTYVVRVTSEHAIGRIRTPLHIHKNELDPESLDGRWTIPICKHYRSVQTQREIRFDLRRVGVQSQGGRPQNKAFEPAKLAKARAAKPGGGWIGLKAGRKIRLDGWFASEWVGEPGRASGGNEAVERVES